MKKIKLRNMYGLVVKKQHIHKISVIDMKMLRWISRNRRKYRIQDEKIHLKIRMNPIDERWKESCLRWFGLVQRRERLLHQ